MSAILNIVADTRSETGTHAHIHTHALTHTHPLVARAHWHLYMSACSWPWMRSSLFAHRSPPRPVNLFAALAGMGQCRKPSALSTRVPTCASYSPHPSSPAVSPPCQVVLYLMAGTAHKSHAHHIIIQSTGAKQPSSGLDLPSA